MLERGRNEPGRDADERPGMPAHGCRRSQNELVLAFAKRWLLKITLFSFKKLNDKCFLSFNCSQLC